MTDSGLRELLDTAVDRWNRRAFIPDDPISIPHRFTDRADIEIAGFFAALFAWGNRRTIIAKTSHLIQLMDQAPADFIRNHTHADLACFDSFAHRTFSGAHVRFLVQGLQRLYRLPNGPGLESFFRNPPDPITGDAVLDGLQALYDYYTTLPGIPPRLERHLPNVLRGSAAKRLNMYLRWMVRRDSRGVDFGLWTALTPAQLYCPLDVHSGTTARALGLLGRTTNDLKAVQELTARLRIFDPLDPVKYDFALFGLGLDTRNTLV
jgi:uncharacterized protein (TIGR02757 family)